MKPRKNNRDATPRTQPADDKAESLIVAVYTVGLGSVPGSICTARDERFDRLQLAVL